MNLGIRAHDIPNLPLEELVQEVSKKGFTSVQLALAKSLPEVNTSLGALSPGFAHDVGKTFKKHDIQIAVLGCYINMIHPDINERKQALERFKEHIRYARDFGCSIVGTETGNIHAEMRYTEDNFHEKPFLDVVESVRELVKEAEKFGVIVGIEAGVNHPLYNSKLVRRLLDMVDSNNLQIIFDPVNLLTAETYENQDKIIREAIELFGDRIAIVHAKDFIVEDGKLKFTAVGRGQLNYDLVMQLIKPIKPHINFLMESTTEPYIDESVKFIKEKYNQA